MAWNLPTMAEVNARPHATPKHEMTPAPIRKEEKKKLKVQREKEFRSGVWDRDERRSRASGKPLSPSGSDAHKVGEVHHVIPRSLAPERIFDVANGLLLSKYEHALAETACPSDPSKRLLDIVGPDDRALPQTFIWRKPDGSEIRRRIS
jgi:hypothetical protein